MSDKIRVPNLIRMHESKKKIVALTAYDYTFASLIDSAGVDLILVGDSLGTVVQGDATTIPVTMDQMVYHTSIVSRGVSRALLVADLPFLSYQLNEEQALLNAGRLVQEGGAEAVKLEGGAEVAQTVSRIVSAGIPVVGHLGLTPQSVHKMGGHKVQGRSDETAAKILEGAFALQESGAFAVVLEAMPSTLAEEITTKLSIPTIGIGAGPACSGQILVSYDMLGLRADSGSKLPKFVKEYANLSATISKAVAEFSADVSSGSFPSDEHSYASAEARQALKAV